MRRAIPTAILLTLLATAQTSAPSAKPSQPITLSQLWTLDSTYTDRRHGITFRYPPVWKPATQFGYVPPALSAWDPKLPPAGLGYNEGGFPRGRVVGPYSGTNLEGFGLVYLVLPGLGAAECQTKAAFLADSSRSLAAARPANSSAIFAGRSFIVYTTGAAAMNQSTYSKIYITDIANSCYFFETAVSLARPGAWDYHVLTPAQLKDIDKHLLDIVKTLRILPKR